MLTFHIRRIGIDRSQSGLSSAMAVTLMLALIVTVVVIFALNRKAAKE